MRVAGTPAPTHPSSRTPRCVPRHSAGRVGSSPTLGIIGAALPRWTPASAAHGSDLRILIVADHPLGASQRLAATAHLPQPVIEQCRPRAEQKQGWNPVPEGRSQHDTAFPGPQVPEDQDYGGNLEEEEDQQEAPDRGSAFLLLAVVITAWDGKGDHGRLAFQ